MCYIPRINIIFVTLVMATLPLLGMKREHEEGPEKQLKKLKIDQEKLTDQSILSKAIEENDIEKVKKLLEEGISANNPHGCDEFVEAYQSSNVARMEELLGEELSSDDEELSSDDEELSGDDEYDEDYEPEQECVPPVSLAAKRGNVEMVKLLLDAGADPNATDINRYAALHEVAAVRGPQPAHVKIVQLLLEHGANPNLIQASYTPLQFIIDFSSLSNQNSMDMIHDLLRYGAWIKYNDGGKVLDSFEDILRNIYFRLKEGKAISSTYQDILRLLLLYGGNISIPDLMGVAKVVGIGEYNEQDQWMRYNKILEAIFGDPLIPAIITNNNELVNDLAAAEMLVIDVEGMQIPVKDKDGISALAYAAGQGNREIVKLLLSNPAYQNDTGIKLALDIVESILRGLDPESPEYQKYKSTEAALLDPIALQAQESFKSILPGLPNEMWHYILSNIPAASLPALFAVSRKFSEAKK